MQVNKHMHAQTLGEQFFMQIGYVGQPPSLCTVVTLTHGNGGDSFSHGVGLGFILSPGVSWSRPDSCPHPKCVKV